MVAGSVVVVTGSAVVVVVDGTAVVVVVGGSTVEVVPVVVVLLVVFVGTPVPKHELKAIQDTASNAILISFLFFIFLSLNLKALR